MVWFFQDFLKIIHKNKVIRPTSQKALYHANLFPLFHQNDQLNLEIFSLV